jgi:hypothetical protein
VTVAARVDGQQLAASTQTHPLRLFPRHETLLDIDVTNNGETPIVVRAVRLEGQVVGLTFFADDTSVAMTVAPGDTGSRRFLIDLSALDGQATGLIPGAIKVLDSNRHVIGEETGVVDVRGSLRSVYGLFGLGVAFLTVLSFLAAIVGLARHRLPPNRWRRALRFLTPGLGLGLVINFTLSATRVFVPQVGRWLTITVVCAGIFFAAGYLTPTPDLDDDDDDDQLLDEPALAAPVAVPALAPPTVPAGSGRPPTLDAEPVPAELARPTVESPVTVTPADRGTGDEPPAPGDPP